MAGEGLAVALEWRGHALAGARLAVNAGWDVEILAVDLGAPVELDFDVMTGFRLAEIDLTPDQAGEASPSTRTLPPT